MSCEQNKKEESYDFFKNINRYIKDGKSIELTLNVDESPNGCTSFANYCESISVNKDIAKNICDRLVILYKHFSHGNNNYIGSTDFKNDFTFLNYWVNLKIRDSQFNERTCVDNFYGHIDSHALHHINNDIPNDLIYDIEQDELEKINKLYNLYKEYSELNAIVENRLEPNKEKLLALSTECCSDYIEVKYICNGDNNTKNNSKFCEILKEFESKYEKLYDPLAQKVSDFSDYFIKLKECPNNKIITTAVTGSIFGLIPLLGILYKFTPMRQMFRSKMGIFNNGISNNDEQTINMSLMEQENEPLKYHQGTYNIKYQSL
ncbi:Plasmodium variant antigen protein Cir/Yir/Bir, putative [Plasmodium vivax]|uniref:Plasmodium variant antigen protein Cir/Yir/Bir, putative n=1 Tax=Plasmodium vivax TaxID=5855 RepID=A0A1G4EC21_PLAVI|nr:Plasmodium variant antigen protein Cir/Yir/Bir, putative [Plasmodium vivax]